MAALHGKSSWIHMKPEYENEASNKTAIFQYP